ncbi:hypothetical protein HK104_006022 [Borealophlyctis nickersoniae]|nr:hypothetical protein HK104_006022 [Borealophlyctis nickersoniae]
MQRMIQAKITGRPLKPRRIYRKRSGTKGVTTTATTQASGSGVVHSTLDSNPPTLVPPSSDFVAEKQDGMKPKDVKKSEKFTIKTSFAKIIKCPDLGGAIADALERYNTITYEGLKLLSVYAIQQGKKYPPFDRDDGESLIRQCFYAVSTHAGEQKPRPPNDPRLRAALETYTRARPADLAWSSRAGLNNPLAFAATGAMQDIRRHVVIHLVKRISHYVCAAVAHFLRKAPTFDGNLERNELKKIATRLTSTLVYKEKRAWAIAKAKGEDPPPVPQWVPPDTVYGMLGLPPAPDAKSTKGTKELFGMLARHPAIPQAIVAVFNSITKWIPVDGLPICDSKCADGRNDTNGGNPWMRYYYGLHYRMIRDIEEWNGSTPKVQEPEKGSGKPVARAYYYAWAKREVDRMCTEHIQDGEISRRGKRRVTLALLTAVNTGKELKDNIINGKVCECGIQRIIIEVLKSLRKTIGNSRGANRRGNRSGRIPVALLPHLKETARATTVQLKNKSFLPASGHGQTGRTSTKLWSLLPQPSLTTRYMSLDTTALADIWSLVDKSQGKWRDKAHNERRGIWHDAFHLHRVKGVQFPDLEHRFPKRKTSRDFSYFMRTDGIGCSFTCNRVRTKAPEAPRPTTVRFGSDTIFRAIDPGETDVISGYTPILDFANDERNGADASTMPIFHPDFDVDAIQSQYSDKKQQRRAKAKAGAESTFSMSGREWRYRSGQMRVEQQRDNRTRKLKEDGVDIPAITASITTYKTVKHEVFLEHLRTTLAHIGTLRRFHSKENGWKFYKYRQRQKALLDMVNRVKGQGNERLAKSKIVVAFGNGKFGNTGRKGSRGAPTEMFKKFLARHVTLVLVDEYRTSKVCSRCNIDCCSNLDIGEEEDGDELAVCISTTIDCGEEEDDVCGDLGSVTGEDDEEEEVLDRTEVRSSPDAPATPTYNTWDVDPVYVFDIKGNERVRGAPIHAVRFCKKCRTVWNRDTNAARNIAYVFWYERCHGLGRRPFPFRRKGRVTAMVKDTNSMGMHLEVPPL